MTNATHKGRSTRNLQRLVFVPVFGALTVAWGVFVAFTIIERGTVLERAESQLHGMVATLADFNELAQKTTGGPGNRANLDRTAAIWRAMLQYPAASIWIEANGVVSAGSPLESGSLRAISVEETRDDFTVHAALPEEEALADWRSSIWLRGGILLAGSIVFLVLTEFLSRALRLRAAAEKETAAAEERVTQLALYRQQLEQTVAERTGELKEANISLGKELKDRKAAEEALREHDGLLNAVTKSAAELLGSHSFDEAVTTVIELIGKTIAVGRVQLRAVNAGRDGHLRSSVRAEWATPGLPAMIDNKLLQDLDLTAHFPRTAAAAIIGEPSTLYVDDIPDHLRPLYDNAEMRTFLHVPVMAEGKLWGILGFIDSSDVKRQWSWAETDTLKTLSGLIGTAVARARYVKELADANTIVQNSPTVLYRLRGEPSFPLIYISQNITKFGLDPAKLVASANWAQMLIDPRDISKVQEAMVRVLDKSAQAASIEFRVLTADGSVRWVENQYSPVRDSIGRLIEIEGLVIDITERKAAQDRIALLARTDQLTGLANRATFVERLHQAFASVNRGASPFAVLYLDLDHFKDINDTLGHPVGDLMLKEAAERLKGAVRENDVVARLGGDEFAVLQADMSELASAGALAEKIRVALGAPYRLDGNDLHVTASIGISPFIPGTAGPDMMLSQADLALYRAKDEGRNQYRFHSEDLDTQVRERVALADDLHKALEGNELELYYQPQVELISGKIVGVEALIRWNHPTLGLLGPKAFVPIAEKTGSIIALGHWVLDHVCKQMKAWQDEGVAPPAVSINLSLAQLKTGRELIRDMAETTAKWGLSPTCLELDVTEATLAQTTWTRNDVLAQLRQLGAKIAIDDFGAEYSSFDYLRTYAVNHLKIAKSFVDEALQDPESAATIRAIVKVARELGMDVIVEGVESEEQRKLLVSIGSTSKGQGFLFSKAVPADEATALLSKGKILIEGTKSKNKGGGNDHLKTKTKD